MNSTGVKFEVLGKENYDTWKIQMRAVLIKNDTWGYVSGAIAKPAQDKEAENKTWTAADLKAQSDIILAISPSEIRQVKGCNTSAEIWTKLERFYQSKAPARKATLINELISTKMVEGGDAREHTRKFHTIVDRLAEMEVEIHPDLLSTILLRSLPESYENFRCAMTSRDDLPTPEILRIKIAEESDTRKAVNRSETQNALTVGKFPKRNPKKDVRPGPKESSANTKSDAKMKCFNCGTIGHRARNCQKRSSEQASKSGGNVSVYAQADVALQAEHERHELWCLDSGCTSHMCKDENAFTRITKEVDDKVNLANTASTSIKGRGYISTTLDVNGQPTSVYFQETLHVPDLRTNLASVSKMTDNGYTVTFFKTHAEVTDKQGKVALVANRVHNLYYLQGKSDERCKNAASENANTGSVKKNSLEDWHILLGHLNVQYLRDAIRRGSLRGIVIKDINEDFECEVCLKGKMHRQPFPKASKRTSEIGDIVHSDVCGPLRTPSLGNSRYFCTFTDDKSGWCEVRFLKQKNQVREEFEKYRSLVETQRGIRIKSLQSDNGLEYVNREFDNLLEKHGIVRRLSAPYNPEQNGTAERMNRSIMEKARCLLIQSRLPNSLWGEAVNTANYLHNRCPSRKLEGKTPYEMWFGEPPDVTSFKRFGCKVHVMYRSIGGSKLDPRSREGVFVGYCTETKGHRIWIPSEHKVVVSRDVKFLEQWSIPPRPEEASTESGDETYQDLIYESISPRSDGGSTTHVRVSDDESDDDSEEDFHGFSPDEMKRSKAASIKQGARLEKFDKASILQSDAALEATESTEFAYLSEVPIVKALSSPEYYEWMEAMADEVESILRNNTWVLTPRTGTTKVIGSRFVLRNKCGNDNTIEKRKARVVAKGYAQQYGRDFHETFAPVTRLESVRIGVAIATQKRMHVRQYDVTTAYLNGELEEEVFMEPPEKLNDVLNFIIKNRRNDKRVTQQAEKSLAELSHGNMVCHMKKALYGLKQAGRAWHKRLDQELRAFGVLPTKGDPCVYLKGGGENQMIILVYVDDLLVMSRNRHEIEKLETHLMRCFELKALGQPERLLGMEFRWDESGTSIGQETYVRSILQRFNMTDCNPVSTPMVAGTRLTKQSQWKDSDGLKPPYRELIGCLLYLARATRPDIAHTVSVLSQYNDNFGKDHWEAAKRVLRYLKGSADLRIRYDAFEGRLSGYTDADYAGCTDDRRSFTGFVFFMNGGPVSWESRKQKSTAFSTTEAEYVALSEASREATYLRCFLKELGISCEESVTLFNDNISAQKLATNPVFHSRTKHIDVRYHYVRECVDSGTITIEHVASEDMPADVLTKGLPKAKHQRCVGFLKMCATQPK